MEGSPFAGRSDIGGFETGVLETGGLGAEWGWTAGLELFASTFGELVTRSLMGGIFGLLASSDLRRHDLQTKWKSGCSASSCLKP